MSNNIILATGDGNIRGRFDGTNWSLSPLSGTGTRIVTANPTGQLGVVSGTGFVKADGSVDSNSYYYSGVYSSLLTQVF